MHCTHRMARYQASRLDEAARPRFVDVSLSGQKVDLSIKRVQ